jgi:hypothetical protein
MRIITSCIIAAHILCASCTQNQHTSSATSTGSGGDGGSAASASGSAGTGGTVATSSASGSTGTGVPCGGACPDAPNACTHVECVEESCVVKPVPAGPPCEAFGHEDKCNGGGVCGLLDCASDSDCGPAPKCMSFTCSDDGDLTGKCVAAPLTGGACDDVCAVALTGPQATECVSFGGTPFHCPREGGPAIANVICQQFDSAHPSAWCCKL